VLHSKPKGTYIAGTEQGFLALLPITVYWPRSMDYILRGEVEPLRYDSFAGLYRREFVTGNLKPARSSRIENCAANASAHLERSVGGVDNSVNLELRYIVLDDAKWH